jgi:hypothetical protein
MDRIEQTIRLKDETKQKKAKFKYNFIMALAAALSLFAIYSLITTFMIIAAPSMTVTLWDVIPLIISVVLTLICFNKKDDMLVEYDYIVEDDVFVIAKIKNLKARKEVIHVPVSAFKRIDEYNEENFRSLDIKKINCSLNDDANKYVLTFERGERCAVVFEPNEDLLKMIKKELNK